MSEYDTYGQLAICDMYSVDPVLLNNMSFLKQICKFAIAKANATFVSMQEKQFEPHGITITMILQESSLSIHTYPERGAIMADVFTCGRETYPDKAIDYLIEQLKPDMNRVYRQLIIRGVE